MNTRVKDFSKKLLVLASSVYMCSMPVTAATVTGKTTYLNDDYGTSYSYTGYKSELKVYPDNSNAFLTLESRRYDHESGDVAKRQGAGIGYRFNINGGHITTELKLRTEETTGASPLCQTKASDPTSCEYKDGSKVIIGSSPKIRTLDYTTFKTTYGYALNNNFRLTGRFDFALIEEEFQGNKENGASSNSEHHYFFSELRPGLKVLPFKGVPYFKNMDLKNASVDFIYYYANKQSTKGGVDYANGTGGAYGLDDSTSNQQIRIDTFYKSGPLKFGTFARIPMGWGVSSQWYESGAYPGILETKSKALRLGFKFNYQFSEQFSIVGEIFQEDITFHDTQNVGKEDIDRKSVEIGLGYKF